MKLDERTPLVQNLLIAAFLRCIVLFLVASHAPPSPLPEIPLVDPQFTNTATVRLCIADQIAQGADPDDWDCYLCHEEDNPPELKFDENHNLIIPEEHEDLGKMGHGRHRRNNNCYNCHDQQNLTQLQTRDGRELKLWDSTPLCGSCHGPVYRDWEGGAHGRTGGQWDPASGKTTRRPCVSCHNPHAPPYPDRTLAPGPHPLHAQRHEPVSNAHE